jgi:hypothetical protein
MNKESGLACRQARIKNRIFRPSFYFLLFTFYLLLPRMAAAVCPVCTVGVIAGLGLSRYLGVDDTVSGVWIGGILASFTGWTVSWLHRKKIKFIGMPLFVSIVFFGTGGISLFLEKLIGHPFNKIWGIDKLILGIAVGTLFFAAGVLIYEILKKKNGGKAHFPYEKIVFPIAPLIIMSVVFYYVTKR